MAASSYTVTTSIDRTYRDRVSVRSVNAIVRRALSSEQVVGPLEVGVLITSDNKLRALNRRFRGQDEPTDVLSFGGGDSGKFVAPSKVPLLGEIVISYPTARRQAREASHQIEDELRHLLAHGVLHLLGYDHERTRDARLMHAREQAILGANVH